ncbi:MAG: DUF2167 domain-containing protein [Azoarcus sp.]|jgi:uncharacterized membrane-anchored protein|nr:DUF2167 domain-containing protein [Azoarcus sp.]
MDLPSHARKAAFLLQGFVAALLICFGLQGRALAFDAEKEIQAAYDHMLAVAVEGPQEVPLGEQASIRLPKGFAFVPRAESEPFMRLLGNDVDADFIGLIFSEDIDGFVSVAFTQTGFVRDDDARQWDIDDLLQNIREGTRQANKERRKHGIPTLEVLGWIEKPAYDDATHRLVWSISARGEGVSADEEQGVNYNTFLLGREGYLSLNLVTDTNNVGEEKPLVKKLLAAVSFNPGKRYEDFDANTDRVAEYGLAALVGGLAVKKLGLLAAIGVFLAKAWKFILIGLIAIAAGYKAFFRRDKPAA